LLKALSILALNTAREEARELIGLKLPPKNTTILKKNLLLFYLG